MKVVILGSSGPDGIRRQYSSTYLINANVAIDAGCLGVHGPPEEQQIVSHVFLTHAHADHIASLPLFIENVWTSSDECPIVYGSAGTLATVRRCVFNDEVWPDFVAMSERMPPFLRLYSVQPEVPITAAGLTITAVPVEHLVPTYAYVVQDDRSAVIFGADSGPTTRLWEVAQRVPALRAIFLEAAFPNRMRSLAKASCHLTPSMFGQEVGKVSPRVKVIAVHLKVRFFDEIKYELQELGLPNLEIGECEREYVF
jgi:ribonuclease BN (tRNA processing enzyme)